MPADVLTSADAIDRHLGVRLRLLRKQHRMSLQTCGDILGVTYQQVQKYETGANRLSTVSLLHLARAFGIAPALFFEGLDAASSSVEPDTHMCDTPDDGPALDYKLMRAITRLSPLSRQRLGELVLAIEQGQARRSAMDPLPSSIGSVP